VDSGFDLAQLCLALMSNMMALIWKDQAINTVMTSRSAVDWAAARPAAPVALSGLRVDGVGYANGPSVGLGAIL